MRGFEVEKLVMQAATPVNWFVLDAEAMVGIDTTGEEVLHQVLTCLANRGVTVAPGCANQPTAALLARYHLKPLPMGKGSTGYEVLAKDWGATWYSSTSPPHWTKVQYLSSFNSHKFRIICSDRSLFREKPLVSFTGLLCQDPRR